MLLSIQSRINTWLDDTCFYFMEKAIKTFHCSDLRDVLSAIVKINDMDIDIKAKKILKIQYLKFTLKKAGE